MKKIEVREYAPAEQIVIVYESDDVIDAIVDGELVIDAFDDDEVDTFIKEWDWVKVDLFDPMLKYDSNCNIGYRGQGPSTLARIIVQTFRDYPHTSKEYVLGVKAISNYLASLDNDYNNAIKNFTILESDVEFLLKERI